MNTDYSKAIAGNGWDYSPRGTCEDCEHHREFSYMRNEDCVLCLHSPFRPAVYRNGTCPHWSAQ